VAIAAAADAAAFGMEHHRQRQQHRQQGEEAIGRGGGERRQPMALALRQGTPCHRPPSGLGQGGATGTRRQFDPLSQLAAEAESGCGAK